MITGSLLDSTADVRCVWLAKPYPGLISCGHAENRWHTFLSNHCFTPNRAENTAGGTSRANPCCVFFYNTFKNKFSSPPSINNRTPYRERENYCHRTHSARLFARRNPRRADLVSEPRSTAEKHVKKCRRKCCTTRDRNKNSCRSQVVFASEMDDCGSRCCSGSSHLVLLTQASFLLSLYCSEAARIFWVDSPCCS